MDFSNPEIQGALLCIAGAMLVGLDFWHARGGKGAKHGVMALIGLLVCCAWATALFIKGPVTKAFERPHMPFHYAVGAKYYRELGHYSLYRQTLLAGAETGAFDVEKLSRIRHLEDYSFMDIDEALDLARKEQPSIWTEQRWHEFKADIKTMGEQRRLRSWKKYLGDHGYNPPPVRNIIPGWLIHQIDWSNSTHTAIAVLLDPLLVLLAIVFCGYICGWRSAAVMLLFLATAWYDGSRTVGNYLNYMWLAALICAVASVRAGKHRTAGALLAVAACFRIFPAFFIVGPIVVAIREWVQTKQISRPSRQIIASFFVSCLLLGVLGLSQGRGPESTYEFVENLSLHAKDIKYGGNKVGLTRAMGDMPTTPKPGVRKRKKQLEEHPVPYYSAMFLMVGLALGASWRKRDNDAWAIPLGMCFIFAIITLSRYYYLALLVFLIPISKERDHVFSTWAAVLLLLGNALWLVLAGHEASRHVIFSTATKGWMFVLLLLPLLLIFADRKKKPTAAKLSKNKSEPAVGNSAEGRTEAPQDE